MPTLEEIEAAREAEFQAGLPPKERAARMVALAHVADVEVVQSQLRKAAADKVAAARKARGLDKEEDEDANIASVGSASISPPKLAGIEPARHLPGPIAKTGDAAGTATTASTTTNAGVATSSSETEAADTSEIGVAGSANDPSVPSPKPSVLPAAK
jgi:hypothetical protein